MPGQNRKLRSVPHKTLRRASGKMLGISGPLRETARLTVEVGFNHTPQRIRPENSFDTSGFCQWHLGL